MPHVSGLRCRECDREYPVEPLNVCDFCFGPLEVVYDYVSIGNSISRESIANGPLTMWRYHDLLPVNSEYVLDMGTGFTPLVRAKNLGRVLGLDNLYIKNDSVNPTFSFKDRGCIRGYRQSPRVRVRRARLRLYRQPGRCGSGARRQSRHEDDGLLPGRPREGQDNRRRHLRRRPGRRGRHLRPGQPAMQRAGRQPPLGVRKHQQ